MVWDVRDKTILVTGATSGIGLEASLALARRGARLVLVGRDPGRTETAALRVAEEAGSQGVSHFLCDFSSQASIRSFAEAFRARHDRLHVLVNNAGGVHRSRKVSADGVELTFAVNHLGYFLLTNLLLDLIVKSAPARIVVVASIAHRHASLDFEDLGFERGYSLFRAYGRSKLANVLFTAELARRLAGQGVTSNSVHPGSVDTNIWSGAPLWAKPLIGIFFRPFFLSAEQGGATIVQLAADPELEGLTGAYFEGQKPVPPAPLARDPAVAARLWDVSSRLVGLSPV